MRRLLLSNWGLPEEVLRQYEQSGITRMFPWQVECLCTGNVLGKKIYVLSWFPGSTALLSCQSHNFLFNFVIFFYCIVSQLLNEFRLLYNKVAILAFIFRGSLTVHCIHYSQ